MLVMVEVAVKTVSTWLHIAWGCMSSSVPLMFRLAQNQREAGKTVLLVLQCYSTAFYHNKIL